MLKDFFVVSLKLLLFLIYLNPKLIILLLHARNPIWSLSSLPTLFIFYQSISLYIIQRLNINSLSLTIRLLFWIRCFSLWKIISDTILSIFSNILSFNFLPILFFIKQLNVSSTVHQEQFLLLLNIFNFFCLLNSLTSFTFSRYNSMSSFAWITI